LGPVLRDGLLDGGYIIKERRNPDNLPPIIRPIDRNLWGFEVIDRAR